jgi:hypothetical protein
MLCLYNVVKHNERVRLLLIEVVVETFLEPSMFGRGLPAPEIFLALDIHSFEKRP